ncbi:MAG: cobalamin B12-binding domain-containing protein [Candidatus Atribacteria bacterium]|nr:cobalamin B12-binding domain-containing protein [Candidatus Atribacteria bacterium]
MKVLLLYPPPQGIYHHIGLKLPPLGLAYLASFARKRHEIHILDLQVEKAKDLEKYLDNYEVVGISALTNTIHSALRIARMAKAKKRLVIMGGYHPTFQDEEVLRSGFVDIVIRGEGEETFLELLEHLESGKSLTHVSGISFLEKEQLIRTSPREPFQQLDHLPFPAWDLLPLSKYWMTQIEGEPLMSVVTSRGCPFGCTFCVSSRFSGKYWRARSPENVFQELERLYFDLGYRAVAFVDDNFTLSPERVERLCEKIEQNRLKMKWWCFSRADTIARNESTIKKMVKAGLRMVYLGLESVEKSILDEYRKNLTLEATQKAIDILHKYGVRIWGSFILGSLKDTKDTIKKTVEFARNINPDIVQFSLLTPFPGTTLYDEFLQEKRLLSTNWSLFDGAHPVIKLDTLKPKELRRLLIRAYLEFYRKGRLPEVLGFAKKYLATHIPFLASHQEEHYLRKRLNHENSSFSAP